MYDSEEAVEELLDSGKMIGCIIKYSNLLIWKRRSWLGELRHRLQKEYDQSGQRRSTGNPAGNNEIKEEVT
jgi:hypothetical protein